MMKSNDTYAIAIDLGGTNLRCAIAGRDCSILRCITKPSGANLSTEEILKGIDDGISETIRISGKHMSDSAGIGIGMPGIVDTENGVIRRAANFPSMRDIPVAEFFRAKYHIPVFLYHDIDMAAVAEQRFGAGRGKDQIICITIGTGIGMGMICNGRLYRGAYNGAGNLGHMIVSPDVSSGGEKNGFILEKMAAAPAIREKALECIGAGRPSVLVEMCGNRLEKIDARMVFQAAGAGDEVGLAVVQEAVRFLAIGIANVINLFSPEVIIIGGGVALAGDILFDALRISVHNLISGIHSVEVPILPSGLGEDGVLKGVAYSIWSSL